MSYEIYNHKQVLIGVTSDDPQLAGDAAIDAIEAGAPWAYTVKLTPCTYPITVWTKHRESSGWSGKQKTWAEFHLFLKENAS